MFKFFGIQDLQNAEILSQSEFLTRQIQFVGDSDTAGYCINGTPDQNLWLTAPTLWQYESCLSDYSGLLSAYFNASSENLSISGIGVYQNNYHEHPWMLGDLTLPDYYNRTLQSEPSSFYEPSIAVPDLVVYAVGGNDYVSQGGNFPPSDKFITANINFFL